MAKAKLEVGEEYSVGLERTLELEGLQSIMYTGMLNAKFFSVLKRNSFNDYILNCPVDDEIEFGKHKFQIRSVKPKELVLKYLGKRE